MKKKWILCLLPAVLAGCTVPDEMDLPPWEVEILAPVMKARFSLSDLLSLVELNIADSYDLQTFGYGNTPVIIPSASGQTKGPFVQTITDKYMAVELSKATVGLTVTNNQPVNIKAGTQIVLINGNNGVIATFTLPADLATGQSWSSEQQLTNVTYTNVMKIELRNWGTDGSGGNAVQTQGSSLLLQYSVSDIKVERIEFEAPDDVDMNLVQEVELEEPTIDNYKPHGRIISRFDNRANAGLTANIYFLSSNNPQVVIDSLYENRLNVAPGTLASPVTTKDTVLVNIDKYKRIAQAKYALIIGTVHVPGGTPTRVYTLEETVDFKLIGDLTGTVNGDDNNN